MPSSEAVRKEFFGRMRNMWIPTTVKEVHTYYDLKKGEQVVEATKSWPEADKLPKERWPKYVGLDSAEDSEESEGESGNV